MMGFFSNLFAKQNCAVCGSECGTLHRSKLRDGQARLGLGWSVLPRTCLDDFDGTVRPLCFQDGSPLKRDTYVLYHSSYHELQQVRLFLDTLVESERLHHHP